MYRKYDPVTRMLTDRDSGLLNDYFVINKDQLINLVMFSTMGASPNDREETKSVEDVVWKTSYSGKENIFSLPL